MAKRTPTTVQLPKDFLATVKALLVSPAPPKPKAAKKKARKKAR